MLVSRALIALLCAGLLPRVVAGQSRGDTVAVTRVVITEFASHRPVFIEVRKGLAGHVHDGGSPRDSTWLSAMARIPGVAGVCDTIACQPSRPEDFRMIRITDPIFLTPDSARVFAVLTLGEGAPGCRNEDRIEYDLTIVRQGDAWLLGARRGTMQAWVVESLCLRSIRTPP
jgi:hypothetical protein